MKIKTLMLALILFCSVGILVNAMGVGLLYDGNLYLRTKANIIDQGALFVDFNFTGDALDFTEPFYFGGLYDLNNYIYFGPYTSWVYDENTRQLNFDTFGFVGGLKFGWGPGSVNFEFMPDMMNLIDNGNLEFALRGGVMFDFDVFLAAPVE